MIQNSAIITAPVKPAILLTEPQFEQLALGVLSEYSKTDLLLDTNDLLITRVRTPIIASGGILCEGTRKTTIRPCEQSVVQVTYFAKHGKYALVASGYLVGESIAQKEKDEALKRALLAGIREHWGLLKKQVAA